MSRVSVVAGDGSTVELVVLTVASPLTPLCAALKLLIQAVEQNIAIQTAMNASGASG